MDKKIDKINMFSNLNSHSLKSEFKNLRLPLVLGSLVGLLVLYLVSITGDWLFLFTMGLLLLGFASFARIQQGSWLAPGAFFALYWAVFVLLALIILPDSSIQTKGILWILFVVFAVYMGSIIGSGRMLSKMIPSSTEKQPLHQKYNLSLPWLSQITFLCSILGLGAVIVLLLSIGQGFSSLFSSESMSQIGREYSLARYSDPSYRESSLAVALFTFIYLGALFGGVLFAKASSKIHRLIALLPFIPAVGVAAILTTRGSLLFPLIMWVGAYFSTRVAIGKGTISLFSRRNIGLGLVLLLLILIMITVMLMWRGGISGIDIHYLIFIGDQLRVDIFGSLAAFTQWFPTYWQDNIPPSFGIFTFSRPLSILGIHPPWFLTGRVAEVGNFSTTIFTLFDTFILDFTLVGSLLIFFIIGMLGGKAFYQLTKGKGKSIHLLILMVFYAITLTSFIGSPFCFTTLFLTWVAFIIYLLIIGIGREIIKNY